MDDPTKGLYGKYRVERVDGKNPGSCIVLQLDDPNSWAALRTWADTVEAAGFGPLATDTRRLVDTYDRIERTVGGDLRERPCAVADCTTEGEHWHDGFRYWREPQEVTPGISVERQTLFWIRDQLWRSLSTTVAISPLEAGKLGNEINAVLDGEPTHRTRRLHGHP